MKDSFVIIDGNYMLFRSIVSGLKLKSSTGDPTGGIFIFLKSLWSVTSNYKNFIVVFDYGKNSKRTELYPEYKKRKVVDESEKTKDDLIREAAFKYSFDNVEKVISLLGIPFVKIKGHEADDIIFYLSEFLSDTYEVIVASDDYDYIQMIGHGAKVLRPMKGDIVFLENLEKVFPYDIKYFTLFKAICGDGSDNISGISNIGEGTALKMIGFLQENNLDPIPENLYEWANSGSSKRHEKMREESSIDIVDRNLKLIDIKNMAEERLLYITKFKEAIFGVAPNYEEASKILHSMDIRTLPQWLTYCKVKEKDLL